MSGSLFGSLFGSLCTNVGRDRSLNKYVDLIAITLRFPGRYEGMKLE